MAFFVIAVVMYSVQSYRRVFLSTYVLPEGSESDCGHFTLKGILSIEVRRSNMRQTLCCNIIFILFLSASQHFKWVSHPSALEILSPGENKTKFSSHM
jgi:hypothetical protein